MPNCYLLITPHTYVLPNLIRAICHQMECSGGTRHYLAATKHNTLGHTAWLLLQVALCAIGFQTPAGTDK